MGRCLAVALLGIGVLSLSCNQVGLPTRQASTAPGAPVADITDPSDAQSLGGLEARFEDLARRLAPSVVAVSASSQIFDSEDVLRSDDLNADKLEGLLDRTTRIVGTGLVIDRDGYILTNEHVVGEAENVWVTLDNGRVYPALVVGTDPRSDLAVLKIPVAGLVPVAFAPDADLRRGQWAIALGNPYGLATAGGQCISVGVISALDRSLPKLSRKENRLYSGLIQTTTPINPGNSGGPLFDINGRVIGINTAVILPEKKTNGIGFAMPVSHSMLASVYGLKEGREIVYAYLGVSVSTPTPRERHDAGVDQSTGVRVESVDSGSPAEAVLSRDDLLLKINNEPVRDSDHFVRLVGRAPTDRPTELAVRRSGEDVAVRVTLKRRTPPGTAITRDTRRMRWEGLLLGPVPQNWTAPAPDREAASREAASREGAPAAATVRPAGTISAGKPGAADRGLVVLAVSPRSRFAKDGIREGDVITAIAGKSLADVTDLQQLLNDLPKDQRTLTLSNHKGGTVASASARD